MQYEIPQALLTQLNEFSYGGYMLFTFDEGGNPVLNSNFDSNTHAIAMHSHIRQWSQAIEQINLEFTIANLLGQKVPKRKS